MNSRHLTTVTTIAIGILLVVCVAIVIRQGRRLTVTGEEGLSVWFYDESEERLYAVPRDTIPPHKGVGGTPNDGVRAIVVASPSERNDPTRWRIAYLETCTPELKKLLEGIRAARSAGRKYEGALPDREGAFVQKNTLVRRPGESQWHAADSPAAWRIMNEWRGWVGHDGRPLVVCVPD